MRRSIAITFSFDGVHWWTEAPEEHAYLRNPHRHLFAGKAFMAVTEPNREVEFIALKRIVEKWCRENYAMSSLSCEQMAHELCVRFGFYRVEIWEDGENGGIHEV